MSDSIDLSIPHQTMESYLHHISSQGNFTTIITPDTTSGSLYVHMETEYERIERERLIEEQKKKKIEDDLTNQFVDKFVNQKKGRFEDDIKRVKVERCEIDMITVRKLYDEGMKIPKCSIGKIDIGSILSNSTIIREWVLGNIIIEPFCINNLAPASYDVTLGKMYYKMRMPNADNGFRKFCNIYDERDITTMWNLTEADLVGKDSNQLTNIQPTDRIIWLRPHETILCHTNEAIGGSGNITTKMFARSSIGRAGIQVCACAGLGDPGYRMFWTMEIKNNNPYYTIPLIVGTRIAQIQFYQTDPLSTIKGFSSYTDKGKYHSGDNLEKAIAEWDYSMMLPKLYKDKEIEQ